MTCGRLKWFHVYRVRLILNHDEHVGRHLHVHNASGKYNAVSCRQAAELVFTLLYRHASFVLIDKHTYITLLYRCNTVNLKSIVLLLFYCLLQQFLVRLLAVLC